MPPTASAPDQRDRHDLHDAVPPASRRPVARAALLVAIVFASLLGASVASAKEIGSGGGTTTTTTTCNPVASLTAKGDARAGETGLATIDVSYGVKPCIKDQSVTVGVQVYETLTPTNVVWSDPAAALNGKFTVFGVKTRTSYLVKVTVTDASTGAVAGVRSISVAAIPKGV